MKKSRNSAEFRRNFSQFRTEYGIDGSKKTDGIPCRRNSVDTLLCIPCQHYVVVPGPADGEVPTLDSIVPVPGHVDMKYPCILCQHYIVFRETVVIKNPSIPCQHYIVQYTRTWWHWESLYPVPTLVYSIPGPDDAENPCIPCQDYSTVYPDLMTLRIPCQHYIVQYTWTWCHWESLYPVPTL
jgi:hypothetical protein